MCDCFMKVDSTFRHVSVWPTTRPTCSGKLTIAIRFLDLPLPKVVTDWLEVATTDPKLTMRVYAEKLKSESISDEVSLLFTDCVNSSSQFY